MKKISSIILLMPYLVFLSSCKEEKKDKVATTESISNTHTLGKGEIKLFNEKNFEGWYFVAKDSSFSGGINALFEIEDGVIHVLGKPENNSEQSFAGIVTEEEYDNYDLYLEYKWGDKKFKPRDTMVRDAGILFHMHGPDVIWPSSVECQIQEGDTGDIWAINTQVTSKVQNVILNYSPNGDSITRGGKGINFSRFHRGYDWEKPHGEWNQLKIEVAGDYAKYTLNGQVVNEAIDMKYWNEKTNTMEPLTKGKILLQAEGAEIYYKNVTMTTN